ncbi:hypothetical protein VD0002_g9657 [Verticillium dahliae]|uniref:HIT-type domain-containing protein n=2 Tax=Verticillium dahliae TaxID=27337 RepID=G2X9G0_VERDV|nr:uncharacterized protein VDAG_06792 [Verticillium dahliae VdLs.17]KAH6667654.1 hypothetical protein EV126DRAFT_492862 [Verticillium dahliae]EGY15628.1 hypothetical protein VDAG_06792 [Verticillium dahliae VdLs.17]PNH35959.1 hypothetical protein BJF96_g889 [Verticillium dahliae]PNH41949.1 hypothetical protein VD0003_g9888 [Verticillium dahliae]PNH57751.1 hypothetical protein VD0002_g9657 [Verticillium dahliae]
MSVPEEALAGGDDRTTHPTAMEVDSPVEATPSEPNGIAAVDTNPPVTNGTDTNPPVTNGTDTTVQPSTDQAPNGESAGANNPPPPPPQPRLCGVCNEKPGKYKCTRCSLPFCSVPCNKFHRENHPPDSEPASPGPEPTPAAAPAVEGPPNPFRTLSNSDQLRYLFRRYPNLADQLLAIGAKADPPPGEAPPTTFSQVMAARAAAAAASGKHQKKEQWNHDVGIRKGKEALRAARKIEGEAGEGVREYTELVLHLVAQHEAAAAAAGARNVIVDGSSTRQDAELIKRLLDEDTR